MAVDLPEHLRVRYGVRPTPWYLRVGIAVAVGSVAAVLVVLGYRLLNPGVSSRLLAWSTESPTQVAVAWELNRPSGAEVICVLRAQDRTKIDVGYATVTIARGATYVQPRFPLRTNAAAYSVQLLGCEVGRAPDVDPPQFPPGVVPPAQPSPGVAPLPT